jgi:hypothetical protein
MGDRWRIGIMDIHTGSKGTTPASNYAVAVLQREIFNRSSIVGFIVNKDVISSNNEFTGNTYNRVAGLEYNFANRNNKFNGKTFYHQSFYPGSDIEAATASASLNYSSQYLRASLDQSWIGSDYIAEAGYIRRTGVFEFDPEIGYTFYPSSSKNVISHGPDLEYQMFFNPEFHMTDRETRLSYRVNFKNMSQVSISGQEEFVELDKPYDPTNTGGVMLPAGERLGWKSVMAAYNSDIRKSFNYTLNGTYGGYYNGERWNLTGVLNYRVQPYGSVGLTMNYNKINLPKPYSSASLILVGPSVDITFTDKLFLTTFVQYNNQIDNINMNIRFQWRFAPVSDLFIVYTGNSYSENFLNKNRGLVVKLSYWFN